MPTKIGGRPLRRAAAATMGMSSTSPTSKKTGMPTRIPNPSKAQGRPFLPQPSTNADPRAPAPPDLARRLPRMAPRPSTIAMWPMRLPTPREKETGICLRGMPAATPNAIAPMTRAMAGCRRTRAIRTSSNRTAPAAQASRNQLEVGGTAARSTEGLFHMRLSKGVPPLCRRTHFWLARLCYHRDDRSSCRLTG